MILGHSYVPGFDLELRLHSSWLEREFRVLRVCRVFGYCKRYIGRKMGGLDCRISLLLRWEMMRWVKDGYLVFYNLK